MTEQTDILIARYFTGEASGEEIKLLLDWVAASDANRKYFEQMKLVFDNASVAADLKVDEDAAWQKIVAGISADKQKKIIGMPVQAFMRMAAVISILIIGGLLVYLNYNKNVITSGQFASAGKIENFNLPDSSTVVLNKNSEIKFAYDAKRKQRLIKLKGEAFFDVKHDSSTAFIVEAGGISITDIGTAFNVKANEGSDEVFISVLHGVVALNDSVSQLTLSAGESAVYNKIKKQFNTQLIPDSNAIAYKTGIFNFNNTSLDVVVAALNEVYETQIGRAHV